MLDETRDGAYDVAVHRHSDFQRVNGDVVENRRRLLVNRLCVNGNRSFDPRGVLHRQRRDGRRAITPQGRKRFQVGLYSRAAVGSEPAMLRQLIYLFMKNSVLSNGERIGRNRVGRWGGN